MTSLTDTGLGAGDIDSDGSGFFEVHLQTLTAADAPGASGRVVSVDRGLKGAETSEQPLPARVVADTVACDTSALVDSADEGYCAVEVPNATRRAGVEGDVRQLHRGTRRLPTTRPGVRDSAGLSDVDTGWGPTTKVGNKNITLTYTLTNTGVRLDRRVLGPVLLVRHRHPQG